jgi:hypothetical protein
MMSKLRLFILIILITISFFKCKQNSPVPEVYVNFPLDLHNPVYGIPLSFVPGCVVLPNEGNKGIIIIRTGQDEFAAYDATCTYDMDNKWGRVVPEVSGIFAKDTVCGSKFNILSGGYADKSGPATIPLKMYMAEYNPNTQIITVHN